MLHILETSKLTPVLGSAQRLLDMIESGTLLSDEPGHIAAATAVADKLQTHINEATAALAAGAHDASPFLRHRQVILDHYSTARRLAKLTLHLWNYNNPAELGQLLLNADNRHKRIALELIASYAEHGENDPHFMNLASEILDLQNAEAEAA